MGRAVRGLNKTRVATGGKLLKDKPAVPKKKKAPVNRNKPGPKITTSAAKAAAQKAAIRKKTAARVAAAKKKQR